jgi:hypothetical protein
MQQILIIAILNLITFVVYSQNRSRTVPVGTVPACGTVSGYYRQQPVTLSSNFRVVRNPGTYYAPSGQNQRNWNQYYPNENSYGPTEPNPYNRNGRLSPTRVVRHLYTTRVKSRF